MKGTQYVNLPCMTLRKLGYTKHPRLTRITTNISLVGSVIEKIAEDPLVSS